MTNTIKITCLNASFVDKHNPLHNYSKFNTLSAGLVNTRISGFHLFKSILNFNIPKIQADKITNAYLFIFIKKLQYIGSTPESIGICGNYSDIDTSSILWDTFPTEKFTPVFHLNIPKSASDSYIKINVTEILKELCINNEHYNLVLCPIDSKSQIIATFSAPSSDNPPYLKIQYEKSVLEPDSKTPYNNLKEEETQVEPITHSATRSENPNMSQSENNNKELINAIHASLASHSKSLLSLNNKLEKCTSNEVIEGISEKLTTQTQELSSIKDSFEILNSSLNFDSMIELINSIAEKINFLPEICSYDDLKIISDSITVLSENINSCKDILNNLNEIISSSPIPGSIENVLNLINELKNNISAQNNNIETILKKIDTINISLEKIIEDETIYTNYFSNIEDYLSNQTENINSLKDSILDEFSNNFTLLNEKNKSVFNQINLINDSITSLSSEITDLFEKNTDFLTTMTTSLDNSRINPEDIKTINGNILNSQEKFDIFNTEINSLKDTINNLYTDNAKLFTENHQVIFDHIQSINSIINSLEDKITDLLKKNTELLTTIASSIDDSKLNIDDISTLNDNINIFQTQITKLNDEITSLRNFAASFEKNNTNIISTNHQIILEKLQMNRDNLNELHNIISNLSEYTEDNLKSININFENLFNQVQLNNVNIDSLKDIISNSTTNNLDLLNTNYNSISDKIESTNNNINSIKLEFYDMLTAINLINDKINIIAKVDERLSNYEKVQKINSDNISYLVNNINLLSKDIINIKDSINPIKDNILELNAEILSIKDSINNMSTKIPSNSDNSISCNMDEIKNRLTDLSTSIDQIANSLSDLTIEPLN